MQFRRDWRSVARRLRAKPAELYSSMCREIAGTGHQSNCLYALQEWIAEMDVEPPQVELSEDLASAMIECVRVAEPAIELLVRRESDARGAWTKL